MLERAPDDGEVLLALERLYRRADDKPALLDVLQRRADLAYDDPAIEAPLRLQIGTLALALERTDDAVSAYERVLALKPGDEEAYNALDRIYTESKQGVELTGLLDRQLARGLPSRDAVELHQRLAEIAPRRARRSRAGARPTWAPRCKLDQDYEPAISRLEELIADPDAQVAAADLLEPVYVRRNAWTQLVAIDELRLERSEDAQRRLALTQRIARVYEEQIEDLEAAFRWYGRLFRETPARAIGARSSCCAWRPSSTAGGTWPTGSARYLDEEYVQQRRGAGAGAPGGHRGRRASRRPGHGPQVLPALRRRPAGRRRGGAAVRGAPSSAGRPGTSCATCWRSTPAASASPSDRIPYLRRSAALSAESIGDRGPRRQHPARRCWTSIPPTPGRPSDLESLLRADERWSDLREHLLWMLEQVSEMGGDLNGVAFRLAELEEQKLDDVGAAVERYGEILGRMPRHAGALGALERLLADPRSARAGWPRSSSRTSASTQEWRKLADVLEVSLEAHRRLRRSAAPMLVEIAGHRGEAGPAGQGPRRPRAGLAGGRRPRRATWRRWSRWRPERAAVTSSTSTSCARAPTGRRPRACRPRCGR